MSLRMVRLGDVCEINPRASKSLRADETVSFLSMSSVSEDGFIDEEQERRAEQVRKGYTAFERGDILVAKITPCFENGKATRTTFLRHPIGFGSTEFHVLRASDVVLPDYIFHMVWNSSFRHVGSKNMTGSAGQRRVPTDFLRRLEIPLPPLDEQRRIVAILDLSNALRQKHKHAAELLKGLTQSIFLEMFASRATENNPPRKQTLEEIIRVKSGNALVARDMAVDGNYPVYGGNGINGRHDNFMFADQKIVIGRVGVYCGSVHITDPKSWITDNALYVSELKQPISFRYLAEALSQANLNQYAGRSAQPLISGSRIYPIEIVIPSMDDQLKFERSSKEIDVLKILANKSQCKAEFSFASLQYRAFSGQL